MPQATFLPRAAREHLPKDFMAELPSVKRTISGKGEIKIPIEYAKAKNIYLYTQVIRRVQTPSLNFTFNPDKGFYAHVSFCIDDYVLQTYDINFKEQVFYIYEGMFAQQLVSLICAVRELLGRQPLINSHEHNIFLPNRIKFECFSTTAIILTLKGEKLDLCDEDDSKPNPPPNPPPRIPEIPFDTGTEVDRPYVDDPNNEGTNPNGLDDFKPEGEGEDCVVYQVTYSFDAISDGNTFRIDNQQIRLFGPIGDIIATRDSNGDPQIKITCKGIDDFGNQCETFELRGVSTLIGAGASVEFTNPSIDQIT